MQLSLEAVDVDKPVRVRCPRCTQAMRPVRLTTHQHKTIEVDHCAGCRLVWFNALESVQLDGLGWARLLREMQDAASQPLTAAVHQSLRCPRCAMTLDKVHNRTRFGQFAAHECPQRDGTLNSYSSLLAERGLVRPLGAVERTALIQEKHPIRCLNCGANAGASDHDCTYCGTPLVVIDMPRLAHSLRLRLDGMGPSPRSMGQHSAWACRGCGVALDPGRDTHCGSCGHLVVALEVVDIADLLHRAERDLVSAAQANAEQAARFRTPRIAAKLAAQARDDSSSRRQRHTWMLGGWLPLLVILLLGLGLGAFAWHDRLTLTPMEALRAQKVGDDPSRAWIWLSTGIKAPASAFGQLRYGLLDLHLRQAAGDPWPKTATIGSVIDSSRSIEYSRQLPSVFAMQASERWSRGINRALRILPSTQGQDATDQPGAAVWLPTLRNMGQAPWPVDQLTAQTRLPDRRIVTWTCERQPAGPRLLAPGHRASLICKTNYGYRVSPSDWSSMVGRLLEGSVDVKWIDRDMKSSVDIDRAINALVNDAKTRQTDQLDAFAKRHLGASAHRRWLSSPWIALTAAGWMVAFVIYCAMAQTMGTRWTTRLFVGTAFAACCYFGRGEGAASLLITGMYFVATLSLLTPLWFGFRVYRDAVLFKYGKSTHR